MKVVAAVVTYNRKELLAECLHALLCQTYRVDEIVILDNASTDGTEELIRKNFESVLEIKYIRMSMNTGGAGGFYYASKQAYRDGADWIWLMDDDCIPTPTALEELVKASKIVDCSFLSSLQMREDGSFNGSPGIKLQTEWYKYLAEGIVKITYATFVSFYVSAESIRKCGLPYKNYFIYGDDTEYSLRLEKYDRPGYFVGKSIVIHKTKIKKSYWDEEDPIIIKRLHYLVRNSLINCKEYSNLLGKIRTRIDYIVLIYRIILYKKKKLLKIGQIIRGFWEFYIGNYNKKLFANRFKNYDWNDNNL